MNSHLAVRIHTSVLAPQTLPAGLPAPLTPLGGTLRQLFAVSVCAAPYFDAAPLPPLLPDATAALDPYLPWKWDWRDEPAAAAAGFRWTLLVQMQPPPPPTPPGPPGPPVPLPPLEWKVVRDTHLAVFARPEGWTDELIPADATAAHTTVRAGWWEPELLRLTVENGAWKHGQAPQPYAHAKRLEHFYNHGQILADTEVNEDDHDKHEDLLGARLMRWATEYPPYNYVNRLAAVLAVPVTADLKIALEADYPNYSLPAENIQVAAVPLWTPAGASAVIDRIEDLTGAMLAVAQDAVPQDGKDPGANAPVNYPRRAYSNTVVLGPTNPQDIPVHGILAAVEDKLYVEDEPWRVDAEARLARCLDLPSLLLDWAATNLAPASDPVGTFIDTMDFRVWMTVLSADLFQARRPLAAAVATAEEWVTTLQTAAKGSGLDQRASDEVTGACAALLAILRPPVPPAPPVEPTRATVLQTLRAFLRPLRDPKIFCALRARLEQNPAPDEAAAPTNTDWVNDALAALLNLLLPTPAGTRSLGQMILPGLTEQTADPTVSFPVSGVIDALMTYLRQRDATLLRPVLPAPADAGARDAAYDDFKRFLEHDSTAVGGGKTDVFRVAIYGDRSRPLSKPHGLSLVAGNEEKMLAPDGNSVEGDGQEERAGALVFGRVVVPGNETMPWLSLNDGLLRVRIPGANSPGSAPAYLAARPGQSALRKGYLNLRWSERVDYDNRPLAAISEQRKLVRTPQNQLESGAADRQSPLLDALMPPGMQVPALRYHGKARSYEFFWLHLNNACSLPEKFWRVHPAILDTASIPTDRPALKQTPGLLCSAPRPYLRRVGIGGVKVSVSGAVSPAGTPVKLPGNPWPALPAGVFPIAAELPESLAGQTAAGVPGNSPLNRHGQPLVLLFPPATRTVSPPLRSPGALVSELAVNLGKPSTGDENWERWVSAVGINAPPAARIKVCAEAYRERDKIAQLAPKAAPIQPRWQPDDPALDDQFLIVFRRLYPSKPAVTKAFVRKWKRLAANDAFYGAAGPFFTEPFSLSVGYADDVDADAFVVPRTLAGKETFHLAPGVVAEVGVYALLLPDARARFADELTRTAQGANSLGLTVAALLGDTPAEGLTGDPAGVLAVSPGFFRLETAQLNVPTPPDAYNFLVVSGNGGKASVGIRKARDLGQFFDLVHEVIVQEQIWRWNGKPCLPEDFPGGDPVKLPAPRNIDDGHPAWDGIGFHNREDREHLGVSVKLPLADPPSGIALQPDAVDTLFTDDKSSDARALYFRFSAELRSRYYGVWPEATQAGDAVRGGRDAPARVVPRWKRCVLPHRLVTPLKKPSVLMVLPLLASGAPRPGPGDSAGVLAVVKEASFEQAGLAEQLQCEIVRAETFTRQDGLVKPDGGHYLQAGYDPTLSKIALPAYFQGTPASPQVPDEVEARAGSCVHISGPVGLTFDQGSRDPLIVNSLHVIDVDRAALSFLAPASADGLPRAGHLFCQLRFRRTIRPGYEATADDPPAPHPLASDWTESQWVEFLPDSDLLRPAQGGVEWGLTSTDDVHNDGLVLKNWAPPIVNAQDETFRAKRVQYLFCITCHDLDALGRPATQFHSLHALDKTTGKLTALQSAQTAAVFSPASPGRFRGRVVEVLASSDDTLPDAKNWQDKFFPSPGPGVTRDAGTITEDAQLVVRSLSAAYPLERASA